MKKRIALIGNTAWSMNNFRRGLIQQLNQSGYKTIVLAPYDESAKKLEQITEYHDINIDRKGVNPLVDLKLIYNLQRTYKTLNLDFILHYTIKPIIYGSVAARLAKIPSIAITTGLGYAFLNDDFISKTARILYKFSLNFPKEVWFLNNEDKKIFADYNLVNKNKTDILNSEGVNTEHFTPENENYSNDNLKFLLIARMIWDKGIKEYVEAAKIIKKEYNDIEFDLLGPIDENNPNSIKLEELNEWDEKNFINYLGSTSDVRRYINKSSCVVLPSFYREGVPRTLLEAASMEKPIITTDNVGCRNVVDHNENGYVCEKKSVDDLVDKMEKFINLSMEEKIKMGKKGRKKIKNEFDEKVIVNKYLNKIENYI